MNAQLNANIGTIGDVKPRENGTAFFVVSARDINVLPTAPDSDKWVTIFVNGASVEKLTPLHGALKVGHYINAVGRPGANLNVYEGKISAQKTLNTTPGALTLMGAPLGTGKPQHDAAPAAAADASSSADLVPAGGGGDDEEVGF